MKSIISGLGFLALLFMLPAGAGAEGNEESGIKKGIKGVVSGTISAGKDAVSGVVEGVQDGRKSGDSVDGARVVAGKADVGSFNLKIDARAMERKGDGIYEITLAVHNPNDFSVRLINLNEPRNLVLLDKDGFSYALEDPGVQGVDVTALGRSATRMRYTFKNVEALPATIRLYDVDAPIPQQ